ncbi:hypothetical protein BV22DRAFT_1052389, partial [Leucogyrophana mollusca]
MEPEPPTSDPSANLTDYSTVCTCGRIFGQLNSYTNHLRTCKKSKKRLSGALSKARELWSIRKRPRIGGDVGRGSELSSHVGEGSVNTVVSSALEKAKLLWCSKKTGDGAVDSELSHGHQNSLEEPFGSGETIIATASSSSNHEVEHILTQHETHAEHGRISGSVLDSSVVSGPDMSVFSAEESLAERRPRRLNRRLPARFRDDLPQPPPPPMVEAAQHPAELLARDSSAPHTTDLSSSPPRIPVLARPLRFFHTRPNLFGLSRRYYSDRLPTHDPEETVTLKDLTLTHVQPED